MPRHYLLAASAVAIAATGLLTATPSTAKSRPDRPGRAVTSCSHYGNGCRTFAVRRGQNGLEYLSPGGNWIECRLDCREAVREDVVDFWETLRERTGSGQR